MLDSKDHLDATALQSVKPLSLVPISSHVPAISRIPADVLTQGPTPLTCEYALRSILRATAFNHVDSLSEAMSFWSSPCTVYLVQGGFCWVRVGFTGRTAL